MTPIELPWPWNTISGAVHAVELIAKAAFQAGLTIGFLVGILLMLILVVFTDRSRRKHD